LPWIIDYEMVLEQMRAQKFKCHYYNSGAFGFADAGPAAATPAAPAAPAAPRTLAWIGPDDPTIKPAARALTRPVPSPYEQTLARLASRLWQQCLPGRVWIMPMSHWAYELSHGSREWMPALIENLDLDPGLLETRNNAAAIEFGATETPRFEHFAERLLMMLTSSDFMIAFPGRPALCTLHHHKQLWWTTTDDHVLTAVDSLAHDARTPGIT
jgi:hypothetical protein